MIIDEQNLPGSSVEAAVDDVRVYRLETGAGSIPLSWLSNPDLGLL
jgi:hypothetical protein